MNKILDRLGAALASGNPETAEVLASRLPGLLAQWRRAHPSPASPGDELGRALEALESAWFKGTAAPDHLPGSPDQQVRLSQLLQDVLAVQKFALALAKGDLSPTLKARGLTAGGLKALQASLRHLTWQTKAIAGGDLSQHVDFMGEFSESFNTMVANLASSLDQLKRHSEELARANADLKAANEDMESFSYSVSHDLRAPLRAISGFSRILAAEAASQLDAEGLRLLEIISSNTHLMTRLIDDLLTFSRFGRQKVNKSVLEMTGLVRGLFEEIKAYSPERTLRLSLQDLPPAYGDPALIKQVWVNLLTNAVKFTGPLVVAEIEVGGRSAAGETVYYVQDNGVGFDMKEADKLFGVFQRLHRNSEFEGTGAGLAIVQKIIHRHGGRVWAQGEVMAGATFFFSLPGLPEPGAPAPEPGS